MRFAHLSDLHLGKRVCEFSMLEDQKYILEQILALLDAHPVDGVLLAGDLYDKPVPPAEAVRLLDWFLTQLAARGLPVFAISGNHDSALRISYFSSLVKNAGVYVTETFNGELQHVTLHDTDGDLNVWMMPFLRPAHVKRALPDEKITSYQDAVAAVIRHADIDFSKRNLLICHQFIVGCTTCDSEELSIGTLDHIDGTVFDGFDYVALGHIHGPQNVLRDTMRYAGSPLKYSFSEAAHHKSVTIVDMQEKGETRVHTVPLYPLHDVRLIEGKLADIMSMPYSEDYVWVTIHDELPPPDAKVTLTVNFPNMMKFSVVNSRTKYDLDVKATDVMESKSVAELFSDFYRLQNNDQLPDEAHMQVLNKVIKELEEEPYEAR